MRRLLAALAVGVLAAPPARAQVSELIPPWMQDSLERLDRRPARVKERQRTLDSLVAGRRRWRRACVHEYVLQTHTSWGLPAPRTIAERVDVLSTVRGGRVVDRSRGKPVDRSFGPETIDALFALVERDMRDRGRVVRKLELHPRYGFPVHYVGETPRLSDAELYVDVDSFSMVRRRREATLRRADSALVGRILLAEDRRDSTDGALAAGARHSDRRVRMLAQRARIRIRDARAEGRDSLDAPRLPLLWSEPYWKPWYRELTATTPCGRLRAVLADHPWPVRFRAMSLLGPPCAADDSLATALRGWIDALPADVSRRTADSVSWHAAAHAIVALARMRPDEARPRVKALATHGQWQVRTYSARAAAVLRDSLTLRTLARDADDNVKEAAIEALSALTGHADDELYLAALRADGAPAVRAAAIALKGSPRADVAGVAGAMFERWVARANASERDVRVALLEAAGRPASDDRPPAVRTELPPRAMALALGDVVQLRVTMAPWSGGGSFVVRLRGDVAPMMAARILALARAGYYDGLTWHRVEHDFVIQGGSPGRSEYVGLPQYLRDELGAVPHVRGTVGMSTRGHDTGDAQWFVNLKDNLRLGRDYTVFAEVIEGMDVVDEVLEGDVIARIEETRM